MRDRIKTPIITSRVEGIVDALGTSVSGKSSGGGGRLFADIVADMNTMMASCNGAFYYINDPDTGAFSTELYTDDPPTDNVDAVSDIITYWGNEANSNYRWFNNSAQPVVVDPAGDGNILCAGITSTSQSMSWASQPNLSTDYVVGITWWNTQNVGTTQQFFFTSYDSGTEKLSARKLGSGFGYRPYLGSSHANITPTAGAFHYNVWDTNADTADQDGTEVSSAVTPPTPINRNFLFKRLSALTQGGLDMEIARLTIVEATGSDLALIKEYHAYGLGL